MFPKIPRPPHTIVPWPRERLAAIDFIDEAARQNTVYGLVEFDVTVPLELLQRYESQTGEKLSFTAFVVCCVARAVDEDKAVAAYRQSNRGLVIFEDVDIAVLIERDFAGRKHPTMHFLTAANRKTFRAIHGELRQAQQADVDERELSDQRRTRFLHLPRIVRKWMLRAMRRDPFAKKFAAGTVCVSALGMSGPRNRRGWLVPLSPHTLMVGVGSFYQAPAVVENRVAVRDLLALTVCFDHDVVDGGPAARFTTRLGNLIEAGYELPGGPTEVPASS